MKEIKIKTNKRTEMIDITDEVTKIVSKSKAKEGLCVIYCPHTTAAIVINENADPSVKTDIVNKLSELVPHHAPYSHREGNADAHIKSSLIGNSRTILIKDKRLFLGVWEGIFFAEFDGPRTRKVIVLVK